MLKVFAPVLGAFVTRVRLRLLVVIAVSALTAASLAPASARPAAGPSGPSHPSLAIGRQAFTVTGAVPPRGRPVVLQQRVSKDRWRTVARTHARAGGRYVLRTGHQLAACRYVGFRVVAPAHQRHRRYVKRFTQRVIASRASILVPAVVRPAEPYTVTGLLVPAAVRPVVLQRRDGADGWVTLATGETTRIGTVTFDGVTMPGTSAELRLSAPASHGLPLTRSRPAPVVAHDAVPAPTTTFERVPSAVQPNGGSYDPVISPDGRYVAYQSAATNLPGGGGPDDGPDIFLTDRSTGATTRVAGTATPSDSRLGGISTDGRFVTFVTKARLVPKDRNALYPDVYVYDRDSAAVTLESKATNGTQSDDFSYGARFVGPGGRFVVFGSDASTLTPQRSPGTFLRDRRAGTTTLLRPGHRVPGTAGLSPIVGGPPSGDACDTNNGDDAQVTSFPDIRVERVSPPGAGFRDDDTGVPFFGARSVTMSSNARYFAYVFAGDEVVVTDRQTQVTRRLPVSADEDTQVTISPDGRYVAIRESESQAIMVSDWQSGQLWDVVPPNPTVPSYWGDSVAFSSDDELVFASANPGLVPDDTNGTADVFVAHLG